MLFGEAEMGDLGEGRGQKGLQFQLWFTLLSFIWFGSSGRLKRGDSAIDSGEIKGNSGNTSRNSRRSWLKSTSLAKVKTRVVAGIKFLKIPKYFHLPPKNPTFSAFFRFSPKNPYFFPFYDGWARLMSLKVLGVGSAFAIPGQSASFFVVWLSSVELWRMGGSFNF